MDDPTITGATEGFGLLFYNARWYDPVLGRLNQPDTIIPEQSQGMQAWDHYAYVNNNPLRYTDPSGHCGIGVILGLFGFSYSCPEPLDLGSLIDINVPVKDDNKPDINVPLPPDTESGWIQDPPEPWDDNPFIIDPPEKGDDVPEGYDPVPGNEHEFALLAKKPDIKWIDYIQWKYGLTADQREWLHQQMRRHGLTAEEIEQEAQDLQRQNEEDTEDEEDIDDSAA